MSVFNPRILDASIRDVVAELSDEQKVDVLVYAMQHLKVDRSRSLIENAVQSCLLLPKLSIDNANKARLLRAKARLAASFNAGAHQDLQAILMADPDHSEAKSLIMGRIVQPGKVFQPPNLSTEVWREIALHLSRKDLKTLLLVPHVLSRIAGQLLFRKIDLHFTSDKWESQRSADILTRIITDQTFASHVRTLRIFVPGRDIFPMTFQTGMLANALPKLTNLKNIHCSMRWKDIYSFMKILENIHHRLHGLSLMPSDGTGELRLPRFKHISHFTYSAKGGSPTQVYDFLSQNKGSLRTIHLHNPHWNFPSDVISIRNLTHLDFMGTFPAESQGIAEILSNGIQIESLRLQCVIECSTASTQFREYSNALPFLRHFAFSLAGIRVNDYDLFPAISEFLRDRTDLHTLHLTVPSPDWAQRRLGYDATVWGVLPSLTNLRSLSATLPKDVAAAVATWLVPRGVQALSLQYLSTGDPMSFIQQLRPGLPPGLKFIGLQDFQIENAVKAIEIGFPMVRLARVDDDYYTVKNSPNGVIVEEWPKSRTQYNATEWLEYFECENAEWRDGTQFP